MRYASTRLFNTRTLRSSSPGSSTGVSATKAQWLKRGSLSSQRKGSTPMVPCPICSWRSSFDPRGLGVITMPYANGLEARDGSDLVHGLGIALDGDEIVSGNMRVAGIET